MNALTELKLPVMVPKREFVRIDGVRTKEREYFEGPTITSIEGGRVKGYFWHPTNAEFDLRHDKYGFCCSSREQYYFSDIGKEVELGLGKSTWPIYIHIPDNPAS